MISEAWLIITNITALRCSHTSLAISNCRYFPGVIKNIESRYKCLYLCMMLLSYFICMHPLLHSCVKKHLRWFSHTRGSQGKPIHQLLIPHQGHRGVLGSISSARVGGTNTLWTGNCMANRIYSLVPNEGKFRYSNQV